MSTRRLPWRGCSWSPFPCGTCLLARAEAQSLRRPATGYRRARFVGKNGKPHTTKRRLNSPCYAVWLKWRGRQKLHSLTILYGARREGKRLVGSS